MAVLICTGRVGRAGRIKVGRPPSGGVTGAGRTNVAPGAGLARTAEVGVVAANTGGVEYDQDLQINTLYREATSRLLYLWEERLGAACRPG